MTGGRFGTQRGGSGAVVSTITLATTFSFAWPATEPPLSPRAHWGRGKDREREREGRACPGGVRSLLMPRATEHSGRAANLFAAFPFRPCAVSFAGASSEPTTDHEITTTNRELATRVNQSSRSPPKLYYTLHIHHSAATTGSCDCNLYSSYGG